ncbi:hypothetical protein [Nannocystis radixulma]|uniref:Secreted protein n=1 Tax=Nannocystis radixulma TaxID=2995305 RepID=A0ABT5B6K7_9BACT|nr:hypothetical protein [Nannocystis radixulma]MDC0668661.1 hypothetical protein [Nannocystis radixulma]
MKRSSSSTSLHGSTTPVELLVGLSVTLFVEELVGSPVELLVEVPVAPAVVVEEPLSVCVLSPAGGSG